MNTDTLRRIWRIMPDDAARIGTVAVAMPLLFMAYQLAWTHTGARVVFSLSVGMLGVLVGALIQDRRDVLGYLIGSCSIGATIAAVGSLAALTDPTWTWRTVMAGSQGCVVLGWLILWRLQDRWLARALARWGFIASAAGYALYIVANFGLPDPLLGDQLQWGFTEPRGIVARVIGYPWEPIIAMLLWLAVVLSLRRFLLRHGP